MSKKTPYHAFFSFALNKDGERCLNTNLFGLLLRDWPKVRAHVYPHYFSTHNTVPGMKLGWCTIYGNIMNVDRPGQPSSFIEIPFISGCSPHEWRWKMWIIWQDSIEHPMFFHARLFVWSGQIFFLNVWANGVRHGTVSSCRMRGNKSQFLQRHPWDGWVDEDQKEAI